MVKKKPFAGERFIFADSRSLGRAPWDTYLQNGFVVETRSGIRNTERRNCSGFLSVSQVLHWSLYFVSKPF